MNDLEKDLIKAMDQGLELSKQKYEFSILKRKQDKIGSDVIMGLITPDKYMIQHNIIWKEAGFE